MLSRRKIAELRKVYEAKGLEWDGPLKEEKKLPKGTFVKKGRKRQRASWKEEKRKMIEAKIKEIPKIVDQHKRVKDEFKYRPLKGFEVIFSNPPRRTVLKIREALKGGNRKAAREDSL